MEAGGYVADNTQDIWGRLLRKQKFLIIIVFWVMYLFSSLHLLMSAAVALVNTLAAFLRTLNSPKEITKQIMVKE